MNRIIVGLATLVCLAGISEVSAQGRSLGARMFTIDNGPGNTLTFVYIGDGNDSLNFPSTGMPEGSLDQTLRYSGTEWVANSNLENSAALATVGGGVAHRVTRVDSNASLSATEYDVLLNSADSTLYVTLPTAVNGQVLRLTDLAAGKEGGGVVIYAAEGDEVEGNSDFYGLLGMWRSVTFAGLGSQWYLIEAVPQLFEGGQGD